MLSFTFDAIINPVILLAAIIAGAIVGIFLGRAGVKRAKARIQHLEIELMRANEETLEAQRAYVLLENRLKDQAIPVIPMKINGTKEKATK